jgi:GDP-L-fucose synthase
MIEASYFWTSISLPRCKICVSEGAELQAKNAINTQKLEKNAKIYVAGHRGMVGSAIVRKLEADGFENIITGTSRELDLRDQVTVFEFLETEKPDYIFLAAAKVGGIVANNTYRADFLYENLQIQNNVIHGAYLNKVKKLMFLGSSCIYPKLAPQPLKEDYLLTGLLEPTNEPYAIAKIAGIKMCEAYRDQYGCNFISVMPTNLYGPNDNYDLQNSHVLPAMIRKFHEAKMEGKPEVELWGTGKPMREFLHADDLAEACVYLMENYSESQLVNIGTGVDVTIKELAETIQKTVGYEGKINWNTDKPDGTPRKLMDVSKLNGLGWKHTIDLKEGIEKVYEDFKNNIVRKM